MPRTVESLIAELHEADEKATMLNPSDRGKTLYAQAAWALSYRIKPIDEATLTLAKVSEEIAALTKAVAALTVRYPTWGSLD
jgi:hypothetical protein